MKKSISLILLLLIALTFTLATTGCPPAPKDTPDPVEDTPAEPVEPEDPEEPADVEDPTIATGMEDGIVIHALEVPTTTNELLLWLQGGAYNAWSQDTEPHDGTSPHGRVKVFHNDLVVRSLLEGAEQHPLGAAVVKELYTGDDMTGWAVMVKTQEDSAGGEGWYWFKADITSAADDVPVAGNGVGMCSDCHAPGNDYVVWTELIAE